MSDISDLDALLASKDTAGQAPPVPAYAGASSGLQDSHVTQDFVAARAKGAAGDPVAELDNAFGPGTNPAPDAAGAPAPSADSDLPIGQRIMVSIKNYLAMEKDRAARTVGQANDDAKGVLQGLYQHVMDFENNDRGLDQRAGDLAKGAGSAIDYSLAGPLLRAAFKNYLTDPLKPHMPDWYDSDRFAGDLTGLTQMALTMKGPGGTPEKPVGGEPGSPPSTAQIGADRSAVSSDQVRTSLLPLTDRTSLATQSFDHLASVAKGDVLPSSSLPGYVNDVTLAKEPLEDLPRFSFDMGTMSKDLLDQAAVFRPSFSADQDLPVSLPNQVVDKTYRNNPNEAGHLISGLPDFFDGSAEVLPDHQDPDRIMLAKPYQTLTGSAKNKIAVMEMAQTNDGVEITSLHIMPDRTLNKARGLAEDMKGSGTGGTAGSSFGGVQDGPPAAAEFPTVDTAPDTNIPPKAVGDNIGEDANAGPQARMSVDPNNPYGFPENEPPSSAPFRLDGQNADLPQITPEVEAKAKSWAEGNMGDNPIQASLGNLTKDGALNAAVSRAASMIPRDTIASTEDAIAQAAYTIQIAPEDVPHYISNLVGRMPTKEEIAASAMLVGSAAKEAWTAARAWMSDGTAENWDAATRAFVLQTKLISDWEDLGSQYGLGLKIRQMAMPGNDAFSMAIKQAVADAGPNNFEQAIRGLGALDDPVKAAPYVAQLKNANFRDGLLFVRYNMLLSNPSTIVKKMASDATVALMNVASRFAAEKLGSSVGGVAPGETMALAQGYMGAFGDAFRAAGAALKAGRSQFLDDYQSMDGIAKSRLSMLANGAEPLPVDAPSMAAMNYLKSALPTSWIGSADDFAKVLNFRAELRALAWRDGSAKLMDDAGNVDAGGLTDHVNGILENPPRAMYEQAKAAALANTFQEPLTGLAAKMADMVDDANVPLPGGYDFPVGRTIMAFVKVPANIVKFSYRNSPLPLAFPSDGFKAELAAGGARKDIALARVGLGTSAIMATLGPAMAGMVTGGGPRDPEMRRAWLAAGNQPYSIRIGDSSYQYNRIEPIGQILGSLADTVDIVKFAHAHDGEQAALSLAFGIGNSLLSKTYMTGLSDFLDALHSPATESKRYFESLATSFVVPQGVSGLEKATDPVMRAHYDLLDAIAAKIPGWGSNTLPPARTLWGDPVKWQDAFMPPLSDTGAARMISPVAVKDASTAEPIDKWIWDNRDAFPQSDDGRLGLSKPSRTVQSFSAGNGVSTQAQLTPQQLDQYQTLAGNELKDPTTGLGAKDTLNALVTGKHPNQRIQDQWDQATPEAQAMTVQKIVNTYRAKAKQQVLATNPDLANTVQSGWQARAAALTGQTGSSTGHALSMPQMGGGQ